MSTARFIKNPFVLIPLIAGVVLPCVALLILSFSRPSSSTTPVSFKDGVVISGLALPTTDLFDLNGNTVSPQTLRTGKVLVVFMTTGCEPCRKEMKLLSEVESEMAGKVRVYGIGVESRKKVSNFIAENKIGTNVLLDEDGDLLRALKVKYFPTRFLIQNGVIVNTWFGSSPNQVELFKELGL